MKFLNKLLSHKLIKIISVVVISSIVVSSVVYAAANSLAPTAPPAPTSYSLSDIYNRLMYGNEATENSGTLAPSGTIRSITEVYDAVDVFEAAAGDEPLGQAGLPDDYTDNGDGTVTDHNTGLMWKQCVEGRSGATCTSSQTNMNWATAISTCESLSFAGYSDWYLPNISELHTLVDYVVSSGARINTAYFPNTPTSFMWSSSTSASSTSSAWYVDFNMGDTDYNNKTNSLAVRCVRQN